MLKIHIPKKEYWDPSINEFTLTKAYNLSLEHSLVSISKWESKWKKPFLSTKEKTDDELVDYIKHMTITQNVPEEAYNLLTKANYFSIKEYIDDPMTATTIGKSTGKKNKEIITAELVYHWMIALNVPMECQKWHFNKLLTLINVCNIKNQPPKKVNRQEAIARRKALNKSRREKHNTKG